MKTSASYAAFSTPVNRPWHKSIGRHRENFPIILSDRVLLIIIELSRIPCVYSRPQNSSWNPSNRINCHLFITNAITSSLRNRCSKYQHLLLICICKKDTDSTWNFFLVFDRNEKTFFRECIASQLAFLVKNNLKSKFYLDPLISENLYNMRLLLFLLSFVYFIFYTIRQKENIATKEP